MSKVRLNLGPNHDLGACAPPRPHRKTATAAPAHAAVLPSRQRWHEQRAPSKRLRAASLYSHASNWQTATHRLRKRSTPVFSSFSSTEFFVYPARLACRNECADTIGAVLCLCLFSLFFLSPMLRSTDCAEFIECGGWLARLLNGPASLCNISLLDFFSWRYSQFVYSQSLFTLCTTGCAIACTTGCPTGCRTGCEV